MFVKGENRTETLPSGTIARVSFLPYPEVKYYGARIGVLLATSWREEVDVHGTVGVDTLVEIAEYAKKFQVEYHAKEVQIEYREVYDNE